MEHMGERETKVRNEDAFSLVLGKGSKDTWWRQTCLQQWEGKLSGIKTTTTNQLEQFEQSVCRFWLANLIPFSFFFCFSGISLFAVKDSCEVRFRFLMHALTVDIWHHYLRTRCPLEEQGEG